MYNDSSPLHKLLESSISGLGYELLGFELVQESGGVVLRVYIDHEDGIGIKDCEIVSRHISGVLDVEDLVRGQYTLEVSSPGLDRPLFKPEHYVKFAGSKIRLKLNRMLEGRRKFKGRLHGMQGQDVIIDVSGSGASVDVVRIPFDLIEKGRIIPEDI